RWPRSRASPPDFGLGLRPLGLARGQGHRFKHPARLGLRLAQLVVWAGVGDCAAARLDVSDAVLDDDRADVDACVEVARVAGPSDRAAVTPALDRLELVDDLQRANLRRPR